MQVPNVTNTSLGYCTGLPGSVGNAALGKAFSPIHVSLLPPPLAFFPLTPQQLSSITLPSYLPERAYNLDAAASALFDGVISCSEVCLGLCVACMALMPSPVLASMPLGEYTYAPNWVCRPAVSRLRGCR